MQTNNHNNWQDSIQGILYFQYVLSLCPKTQRTQLLLLQDYSIIV